MVTFLLKDADGNALANEPVPGPGGAVRFGVGEPTGPRSGTFRLWAPNNKGDVYIASRPLAGAQKVSLHESGDWRFQYTRPEVAERWAPGQGRMLDQWRRPPETIDGWTRSFMVWIPESEVTPVPARPDEKKEIVWIPKPEPGEVVAFQVVIARPSPQIRFVKLENTLPLHAFMLSNGEVCMLLATRQVMTPQQAQWLEEKRALVMASIPHLDLSPALAPRVTMFGTDVDGLRGLWDVSVPNAGTG